MGCFLYKLERERILVDIASLEQPLFGAFHRAFHGITLYDPLRSILYSTFCYRAFEP